MTAIILLTQSGCVLEFTNLSSVSVCLATRCLSVTFAHYGHTAEDIDTIFFCLPLPMHHSPVYGYPSLRSSRPGFVSKRLNYHPNAFTTPTPTSVFCGNNQWYKTTTQSPPIGGLKRILILGSTDMHAISNATMFRRSRVAVTCDQQRQLRWTSDTHCHAVI